MPQTPERYHKDTQKPDERRDFQAHGHMNVVSLGESNIGIGTFEPGWKWSSDVKPLVKTNSCQVEHTGYCLSGKMTIKMDDGTEFAIAKGEAFHIPPGHDAWVDGTEACQLVDVTGAKSYAKA